MYLRSSSISPPYLHVDLVVQPISRNRYVYCKSKQEYKSNSEFSREVTPYLLKTGPQRGGRLDIAGGIPEDIRYDPTDDLLGYISWGRINNISVGIPFCSQGRCKVCSKNTKKMRAECNVRLHVGRGKQCFQKYHIKLIFSYYNWFLIWNYPLFHWKYAYSALFYAFIILKRN